MTMHQDFVRGSVRRQRSAALLSLLAMVVIVVVVAVAVMIANSVSNNQNKVVAVSITTDQIAPGVKPGANVILRGAEVGRITSLQKTADGNIDIGLSLVPGKIHGLTDAVGVDFRPENYFGVTALNLTPGAGGRSIDNGMQLARPNIGDFTMSTMIMQGSVVVTGSLSQQMIKILDKVLTYTNGLTPLIQSGLIFTDKIAKTQRALPSVLFGDFNGITHALPDFLRQTVDGAYTVWQGKFNRLGDGSIGLNHHDLDHADAGLQNGSTKLFSAAGTLLKSHASELIPAVEIVRLLADPVPGMVGNQIIGPRLRTMVTRLTQAFGGTGRAPSLKVRLLMEDLPAIASPLVAGGLAVGKPSR